MRHTFIGKAAELFQSKRRRKRVQRTVAALSAVVVFVTTYMLILPAITMENQVLICGMEEHVHTEDCYKTVLVCEEGQDGQETSGYICGQEEAEAHTHDDSCYGLTCGLEETEGHVHDDSCYEAEEVLTCDLEECDGHSHDDSCYDEAGELICGEDESDGHTHDGSCYTQEERLVCGQEECEAHSHDDSCYGLICGKEETEGHTHDESCLPEQPEEETEPAEEHVHTEDCYQTVLVCGMEEHTHTEECYAPASEVNGGAAQPENPGITDTAFPQEIPEGYVEYNFDDEDGLSVTAYAPEDAFGGREVELVAQRLAEDSEDYAKAQQELDEADDVTYDGFAALDVRFEDADGKEIEPEGTVYVRFNVQALLPADVDEDTLSVQHHGEETTKLLGVITTGAETYVQTVADSSDHTGEVIAQLAQEPMLALAADEPELEGEETEPAQQPTVLMDVQAEFAVDSFSTFTITWKSSNGSGTKVSVTCKDTAGNGLAAGPANMEIHAGEWFYLDNDNSKLKIDGYVLSKAKITYVYEYKEWGFLTWHWKEKTDTVDPAKSIRYVYSSGDYGSKTYYFQATGQGHDQAKKVENVKSVEIELTYGPAQDVRIHDDLKTSGTLTVNVEGAASYQWERSADGTSWEEVDRTKVSGDQYNLNQDGTALYVAMDYHLMGTESLYAYKVTAYDAAGDALGVSDPFQVTYYDRLMNGGFETPEITKGYYNQISNGHEGLIWRTTGTGNYGVDKNGRPGSKDGQDVEIVRPANNPGGAASTYSVDKAYGGEQFAEINCEAYGALYQDVLTVPGTTLYWEVAHAGRAGLDQMQVIILDTATAETNSNNLDSAVITAGAQTPATVKPQGQTTEISYGPGYRYYDGNNPTYLRSPNGNKTTSQNNVWTVYKGSYTVPAGQYVTRFFFVGRNAAGGATVGNLVDSVWFSRELPQPDPDRGNLKITKTLTVINTGDVDPETFEFTVAGPNNYRQTVKLPTEKGSWETTLDNLEIGTYTVTEKLPTDTADYKYETTNYQIKNDEVKDDREAKLQLEEGGTVNVTFENVYSRIPKPGSLSITKTVVRTDGGTVDETKNFTFNLTSDSALNGDYNAEVKKGEAVISTPKVTFTDGVANITLKHGETITINGIPQDTQITVTETNTDGYAVSWDNGSHTNATTVTIPRGANAAITCTNTTGAVLPSTGGAGTTHIMSVGAALTLAAGALLLLKRRKEASGAN